MALAVNVMKGGVSSGQAKAINGNAVASAVSAAGTTLGTATALVSDVNVVTTCAAYAGVSVYSGVPGDSQEIYNATANPLYVYPQSATVAMNQIAVGNPFVLSPRTSCTVKLVTSTQNVVYLSA